MRQRSVSLRDELNYTASRRGIPSATVGVLVQLAVDSFADPRIHKIAEEIASDTAAKDICLKLHVKPHLVHTVRAATEARIMQQFEGYLQEKTKISR